ncbi:MAG: Rne/Rng family ribonuclease [Thermodesulfovibrionales bacterium]|nr:Rne/Rng family ribonuclease [Thermodesulfovibrionales bacterium]
MKKILINAIHLEEKRVAIVENDLLIDFYVEVSTKEPLKGNIYKGIVTRIEPSIQAAFIDFGSKKAGFLQMKEIMPEYFLSNKKFKKQRIQDVLSKGQELLVQVEKDERDSKGASLTTYISLAGRYLVMMPGQEVVGVSRKIEDKQDRERLKEVFKDLKPPKDMGFILRTTCSEIEKDELSNDLKYLLKLWAKIQNDSKKVTAPALIYKEHDIAVKTVRDYLTSEISDVIIDSEDAYKNTKEFLRKTVPWRKINIKLYRDKSPIFSQALEEQIAKINDRYVYLPSRGYLVFDKTEALTSIDVNSGRSRKEEDIEQTALKTNLEAADEIARQLRLRDIGGLIVIDFIDMSNNKNRREVEKRLQKALTLGKAHVDLGSISKFGILEMTRERIRPAYMETIHKRCTVCDGKGTIRTVELCAVTLIRKVHLRLSNGGVKNIYCYVPVDVANYLINNKRKEILTLEKNFNTKINLLVDKNLLPDQFRIEEELI